MLNNDDCSTYLRDETEMKLLTLLHVVTNAETTKNVILFARTRQAWQEVGGVDKEDEREVICIVNCFKVSESNNSDVRGFL